MRRSTKVAALAAIPAAIVFAAGGSFAQSELRYDPDRGIMLVDKKDTSESAGPARPLVSFGKNEGERRVHGAEAGAKSSLSRSGLSAAVFPAGKESDRSARSFLTGLDYFKNADYPGALREFRYADSLDSKPVYRLWIAKTHLRLGRPREMLSIMQDIVKRNSRSAAAADALIEMAAYYQSSNDYAAASRCYTQVIERHPSGESYLTGEKYIDIAREGRALMRAEMSNMLAILGYTHETLEENFSAFQHHHHLNETGEGDQKSVSEIKKTYTKMLVREQRNEENNKRARRYLLWAGIAGVVGFLNVGFSAVIFFNLLGKQRLLAELGKTITRLTTRNL